MSEPNADAPAVWAQPTEYSAGASKWMRRVSDATTQTTHPLLASFRREQTGQADIDRTASVPTASASEGSTNLASPYFRGIRTRYEWTSDVRDVLEFNVPTFLNELLAAAKARGDQMESAIIDFMRDITDSHGQTVTAREDQDFADVFIDGIERMEVPFDNDGRPTLQIALNPHDAERLAGHEMTPEQQARMDAVVKRKREEWNAARTRRDLPGLSE